MAKFCPICKKGTQISGTRVLLRGNYNPTKRSRKYPNLQWASLPTGGPAGRRANRIKICTDCLKKGKHLKLSK